MPIKFQNPLAGAAPVLRPTAQPYDIGIGATPPPRRSPSAELAQAFDGFNSELSAVLRDVALQHEQDAEELGKVKAAELSAADGMAKAEEKLKGYVDSGVVDAARAPAFQRGFRTRFGMSVGDALGEALLARKSEAIRTVNPIPVEQIIAEERQKLLGTLAPDDRYAQVGFSHVAEAKAAEFRHNAAQEYQANYKQEGLKLAHTLGGNLAASFAAASGEQRESIKSAYLGHLNDLYKELPASQANTQAVQREIVPAFEDLLSQHRYEEARGLLALADLDVTGKGGRLGGSDENKLHFVQMANKLEAQERQNRTISAEENDRLFSSALKDGTAAADNVIEAQRKQAPDVPVHPSDILQRVDAYAASLKETDPYKGTKVKAFRSTLEAEYTGDAKRVQELYAYEVGDLMNSLTSFRPEDLDKNEALLKHYRGLKAITPSAYAEGVGRIQRLRSLYVLADGNYTNEVLKTIYSDATPPGLQGSGMKLLGIQFGQDNPAIAEAWGNMTRDQQKDHERATIAFVNQEIRSRLSRFGNVAEAEVALKDKSFISDVSKAAEKHALTVLGEMSGLSKRMAEQAKIEEQKRAVERALKISNEIHSFPSREEYNLQLTTKTKDGKEKTKDLDVEANASYDQAKADSLLPSPEREFAVIPVRYSGLWKRLSRGEHPGAYVSLSDLAKRSTDEKADPKTAARHKELYALAKMLNGFTPEEISKGETKHGLKFDPSLIDPHRVRCFRTKAELQTAWNGGQPSEAFLKVGNSVGAEHLTPEAFYRAQLALLY